MSKIAADAASPQAVWWRLPIVWLVMSSLKTESAISQFPPTFLPYSQKEAVVAGYDKPLPLFLHPRPDVVLSDMAPNTVGHRETDHLRIVAQRIGLALAEPPGQRHAEADFIARPGEDRLQLAGGHVQIFQLGGDKERAKGRRAPRHRP